MNGYERALRTLNFETTDCVATWGGWIVSAAFFEYLTGRSFWDDPRAVAFEAYRKLELDMIVQCFYLPGSPDDWRVVTDETLVGAKRYPSPEDVVAYADALPEVDTLEKAFDFDGRMAGVRRAYVELQDEIGADVFCLPECASAKFIWYDTFGYQSYLEAVALYPGAVRKLYEHSAEEARLANGVHAELVKQGALPPFFFMGQDICGNAGPMVSPQTLRELYFPCLRRSFEPLVEAGAKIIWHSDGYIIPIVDDLIACGVAGFQGFQEHTGFDITDIAERRVQGGRKPILLAGVSVDRVLPQGTVRDVEREVERLIDSVGAGGGLAIGTTNTAGPDCRNENIEALYRHAHNCSGDNADMAPRDG